MTPNEIDLLHGYLNDTITDADVPRLQSLLRESSDARRMLRSLCTVEEKLQECAAADPATLRLIGTQRQRAPDTGSRPRYRWLRWRPLTAAAAGVILGMLCTSVVFAYASPRFALAKAKVGRLFSDSFESGTTETLPGLPREAGVWAGDEARVVTAENGVKPKRGAKMLRFISATYAGENAKHSAWGDVYRLVDLRGQAGDGKAVLRCSASFDGARFAKGEEYSCFVELCALEEDPAEAPQPLVLPWVRENSASVAGRKFPMKGDGAWQEATVEVPVSSQTRFVLAHLAVLRRKPLPSSEPVQFHAHYLDDVKLELLTQPGTP